MLQAVLVDVGRRWFLGCFLCLGLALAGPAAAQQPGPVVYRLVVEGTIDPGLAPYVKRVLREAEQAGAAGVVLEINTFGGRVDAAVQIRDALLASPVRTVAFVHRRAISAGALIALATHQIAMAGGSTIGAATPVQAGASGESAPAGEKTVSYVRTEFRATAEARGRRTDLAEAMVDEDVAIAGVVERGKLLTLSTDEALALGLAAYRAEDIAAVLAQAGWPGARLREVAPNWAENIVRILTHPLVSSLLVSAAMLGILVELRTPGFGVPGLVGAGSLALFLWGHWLVALAGWEELLITLAGVVLLLVEVLVLPGFGIAGILGIAAVIAGLVLSTMGAGSTPEWIAAVVVRIGLAVVLAVAASLFLLRFMTRLPVGRGLVLDTRLDAGRGYASPPEGDPALLGAQGIASSPLRPAGIAEIDGRRVDVITDGGMIEAGAAIEVVQVDGNRIVVKRAPAGAGRSA